jgi:hypothetical protein
MKKVTIPQLRKWAEEKYKALPSTEDPGEWYYRHLVDWCSWVEFVSTIEFYIDYWWKRPVSGKEDQNKKVIETIERFIQTGEDNDEARKIFS